MIRIRIYIYIYIYNILQKSYEFIHKPNKYVSRNTKHTT